MASKGSPKDRLSRLFHRSSGKRETSQTFGSPPSSPSAGNSPYGKSHKRNSSSKTSLLDLVSRRTSKSHRQTSAEVPPVPPSYGAQVAASRASGVNQGLPDVPHETDLSSDFQNLTFNSSLEEGRYSEHIADRNRDANRYSTHLDRDGDVPRFSQNGHRRDISGSSGSGSPTLHSKRGQHSLRDSSIDQQRPLGPRSQPLVSKSDPHSSNVADWNIVHNGSVVGGAEEGAPAPLKINKRSTDAQSTMSKDTPFITASNSFSSAKSVTRKPVNGARDTEDNRRSVDQLPISPTSAPRSSIGSGRRSVERSSLNKPLPSPPPQLPSVSLEPSGFEELHSDIGREKGYAVKDATSPINLKGVVDLTNTVDTTLHESWAQAVTHETVIPQVHHIREEQITREIHQHDIYHRVLPIVDIEVKPARHFIPVQGGYAEVAAEELPGRTGDQAKWVIAELASKSLPPSQNADGPRQFTARTFKDTEGDFKESVAPEGHRKTEQHWVHPPTVEDGGRLTGQTYPFYFGSANPADDGLHARLPEGEVIGTSQLYAQKMREHHTGSGATPPVPVHRELPVQQERSALRDLPVRSRVPEGFGELRDLREAAASPRFL